MLTLVMKKRYSGKGHFRQCPQILQHQLAAKEAEGFVKQHLVKFCVETFSHKPSHTSGKSSQGLQASETLMLSSWALKAESGSMGSLLFWGQGKARVGGLEKSVLLVLLYWKSLMVLSIWKPSGTCSDLAANDADGWSLMYLSLISVNGGMRQCEANSPPEVLKLF